MENLVPMTISMISDAENEQSEWSAHKVNHIPALLDYKLLGQCVSLHFTVSFLPIWQVAPSEFSLHFSDYITEKGVLLICFWSCLLEAAEIKCCGGSAENGEVSVQWNFFMLSVCGAEGKRFMQKYTIHESHSEAETENRISFLLEK